MSAVTSSTVAAAMSGFALRIPEVRSPAFRRGRDWAGPDSVPGGGSVGASDFSRASLGAGPLRCVVGPFGRFASGRVAGSGGNRGFLAMGARSSSSRGRYRPRLEGIYRGAFWRDATARFSAEGDREFVRTKPLQGSAGEGAIASRRSDGSTSRSAGALESNGAMGALESVCQ